MVEPLMSAGLQTQDAYLLWLDPRIRLEGGSR